MDFQYRPPSPPGPWILSFLLTLLILAVTLAFNLPDTPAKNEGRHRTQGQPTSSPEQPTSPPEQLEYEFSTTLASITHLQETYGKKWKKGSDYRKQVERNAHQFRRRADALREEDIASMREELHEIRRAAISSSPLFDFDEILMVRRKLDLDLWEEQGMKFRIIQFGFPSNHECNSSLPADGFENDLVILSDLKEGGQFQSLYTPPNHGYAGEIDLHWASDRFLYTRSDTVSWKVWEYDMQTGRSRQVSQAPDDVDCFDAAYLPDGRIVFGSTANYQSVPCWHGIRRLSNLYLMESDGSRMRRLCFDQDHDFHPTVLSNGQVLYNRWDYTGISHIYYRQQMVMNPDGTAQRAIYGSNSWYPNSLYFSREIPGHPGRLVSILSGYHGTPRMGQLVLIDTKQGWYEDDGLTLRISGRGEPIEPVYRDNLVDRDWPKFATPYPLNDHYFLVSAWMEGSSSVGIYLADVFDNLILIKEIPGYALLEPIPLKKQAKPPVIPDKVRTGETGATVYIHDVYAGGGLKGVPRGTIERIRVMAYNFGMYGMAGPDKIGYGGPWEAMQIIGTVPVESDGSAMFRIPANLPVAFQALDQKGRAVQLMRSWTTAMPGEFMSCVGCHESPSEIAPSAYARAALKAPRELEQWYGKPRGFDFEREVQPVLDQYCIECHNGEKKGRPDLRAEHHFPDYRGKMLSDLGVARLHPAMLETTGGLNQYTPAYDALVPYIRRVGIEDDVSLLVPGEYMANTSPLIQLLSKGHHGVEPDREAWERLYTWIDLNGPCHGTWNDVYPVQDGVSERRDSLAAIYGASTVPPEYLPPRAVPGGQAPLPVDDLSNAEAKTDPSRSRAAVKDNPAEVVVQLYRAKDWPWSEEKSRTMQSAAGEQYMDVKLNGEMQIRLVRIPGGQFLKGREKAIPDESPVPAVSIDQDFWMSACEISNAQYRLFKPDHDSRYYQKRHARADDRGLPLNNDTQPALRISWQEALAYCEWLSRVTGMAFSLPSDDQWEYACRAGTGTHLFYGQPGDDFSDYANLADRSFGHRLFKSGGVTHMILEGAFMADTNYADGYVVTAPVGSYLPNRWGLHDMHGNAAEWVADRSGDLCILRGGSFFDSAQRARSSFRLYYPDWQKVFNAGFRVVAEVQN